MLHHVQLMNTKFLMDLLLEPAQALRRELGASYDLVCVPEARAAAKLLQAKRRLSWMAPDGRWLCSLHDIENCEACR